PVSANVLNVDVEPTAGAAPAPAGSPSKAGAVTNDPGKATVLAAPVVPTIAKTWNDPKPTTPLAVESPNRIVGMNYVIVQSYPDEKSANDAVDILARNAIPCTVVKGPPGWANNSWFSVVGTRGYDKLRNNPEYDAYVKKIQRVSDAFAGKSRFKQFDPRPYRWKDTSGGPTAAAQ
ncbi:MAG TPA: hypothetical protein VK324_14370, partial [Tepidisphaeraceae bacterium]|nr:hypothetical protein [Tepidisphaeraceae bacterium]